MTSSLRPHRRVCALLGMVALIAGAACRHAPSAGRWIALPTADFPVHVFGEKGGPAMQLVSMDTANDVAQMSLGKPAYLVMLDVSPGNSIEAIYPLLGKRSVQHPSGKHRLLARDTTPTLEQKAEAEEAYDVCMLRAARTAEARRAATRPAIKRDARGERIQETVDAAMAHDERFAQADAQAAYACSMTAYAMTRRTRPPRTGEHYLVVFATTEMIPGDFLLERLQTLTTTGTDVATTIEAIGAGLFLGSPTPWSGLWVGR